MRTSDFILQPVHLVMCYQAFVKKTSATMATSIPQMVQINPPNAVCFEGPANETLYSTISLNNIFDYPVAYKVKVTVPSKLSVESPKGIIGVGQEVNLNLALQKGDISLLELLVQVVPVKPEHGKRTVDNLMKDLASEMLERKLKVKRSFPIPESAFYSCKSTFPEDEEESDKKRWWTKSKDNNMS